MRLDDKTFQEICKIATEEQLLTYHPCSGVVHGDLIYNKNLYVHTPFVDSDIPHVRAEVNDFGDLKISVEFPNDTRSKVTTTELALLAERKIHKLLKQWEEYKNGIRL